MIALIATLLLTQQAPPAPAPIRIAVQVMPLSVTSGLPPDEGTLLTNALESELAQYGALRVFGASDVKQLLSEAKSRQQLGCDLAAEQCLIEVAGAIGANWLATGSVGKLEGATVVTLRLRDLKRHALLADLTATSAADSAALFETIHLLVQQLIARADPELAKTRSHEQALSARHPVPGGVWWVGGLGMGTTVVGAALLGTGAVLAGNAVSVIGGQRYVDYPRQASANATGYAGQIAIGVGITALASVS